MPDWLYFNLLFFVNCIRLKKGFYFLNLKNPQTFNEKINVLKKLDNPMKTRFADKLCLKEEVKNRKGINVPRTLFVFENSQKWLDFDLSKLKGIGFVIKANHGSGMNKLFQKGQDFLQSDKKEVAAWFKYPSHLNSREVHYKHITKKVFIEELLEEDTRDYKIHSFSGNKQYLQIDYDRFSGHTRNIFDEHGKLMDLEINYPKNSKALAEKMQYVMQNREELKRISENNLAQAKDYHIDKVWPKLKSHVVS